MLRHLTRLYLHAVYWKTKLFPISNHDIFHEDSDKPLIQHLAFVFTFSLTNGDTIYWYDNVWSKQTWHARPADDLLIFPPFPMRPNSIILIVIVIVRFVQKLLVDKENPRDGTQLFSSRFYNTTTMVSCKIESWNLEVWRYADFI